MEKQWISTIELLNYLKEHPNKEKECRLSLGYGLGSTHYWYWDPETNMFMHSRDWDFEPYTASQVVKWYGEGKWKIEQGIESGGERIVHPLVGVVCFFCHDRCFFV